MSSHNNHANSATNGASLEDCHANFFSLTDVCGIKWVVFRETDPPNGSGENATTPVNCTEDPVLASFARCLQAELLSVWRRVPKRDLITYTYDMSGNSIMQQQPSRSGSSDSDKNNLVAQKKELWLFWYGERPTEQFKRLVSSKLKEVDDKSGTWENGLPYEARTLLFKALNNLIERNLVAKDFTRIGKWFVQPFDGPDKFAFHPNSPHAGAINKNTHLSFAFHYFIHGESSVCASVDVRQHPPIRKLSLHHLTLAKGQTTPVNVVLAPYGLSATLTGVTYKRDDRTIDKLLKDWDHFYPLSKNSYFCQNLHGNVVSMPAAVEVMVAGVRLIYPTCYVLVSDIDLNASDCVAYGLVEGIGAGNINTPPPKTMQTCFNSGDASNKSSNGMMFNVEPSAFSASCHPLLLQETEEITNSYNIYPHNRADQVWQDAVYVNPDLSLHQQPEDSQQNNNNQLVEIINCYWDFVNPGRLVKRKSKRQSSREKSRESRNRISSKIAFHKKPDIVDELAWGLDQTSLYGVGSTAGHGVGMGRLRGATPSGSVGNANTNPASMGPPGSVKGGNETSVNSPASLGTPISILTPKAPSSSFLMSPHAPLSNGPLTPLDADQSQKAPRTPKSVPPPSYPAASPYQTGEKSVKIEPVVKQEEIPISSTPLPTPVSQNSSIISESNCNSTMTTTLTSQNVFSTVKNEPKGDAFWHNVSKMKRPALPLKEYELELQKQDSLSDNIYDYRPLHHWLNHPVKKFRPHEDRETDPKRPMYRRQSQTNIFDDNNKMNNSIGSKNLEQLHNFNSATNQTNLPNGKLEDDPLQNKTDVKDEMSPHQNGTDPYEFSDDAKKDAEKNRQNEEGDLFSTEGLKPKIADLDNLFDDSSDEADKNVTAPTPPDSNKPADIDENMQDDKSKLTAVIASVNSHKKLSDNHDQLAHMFPTPPSHEANHVSPAEDNMEIDHYQPGSVVVKREPGVGKLNGSRDLMEWSPYEDVASTVMFVSSKFTPVKLFSDDMASILVPDNCLYKPRQASRQMISTNNAIQGVPSTNNTNNSNKVPTPLGSGNNKQGLSPISPLTSNEGPRSQHGPASVGYGSASQNNEIASPASVQSSSGNYLSKSNSANVENKAAEANSLLLNLVLSDSLLNIFRDHNFDSCTLCVCNNEGNVRGRDAAVYLPADFAGDDDVTCSCGYSAVVNRRLAHQSGLFYEDETEVTSITEDLYFRKKASLLLLDPKGSSDNEQNFNEKSNEVDSVPQNLLRLIHEQSSFFMSEQNSLLKYYKLYLRTSNQNNPPPLSMVELMDGNDVIFVALEQVKNINNTNNDTISKLDEAQKGTCLHKWALLPAHGPLCSEDIIRVMKCLQPILNKCLHSKKDSQSLSVQGPLTWRQFHRMAGPSTKGNTDDQCEPLPVPYVSVGLEKDFLSISPLALEFWESMSLEPFSQPRDIVYMVLAPDNEYLLSNVRTFFENLSSTYKLCRLGRHVPYSKLSILKVGKTMANKLVTEESERWFDLIGDFPTAALLKLYSQVCHHYLLPLLQQMNLDQSLVEPPSHKCPLSEKPPPSPMHGNSNILDSSNNIGSSMNSNSSNIMNSHCDKGFEDSTVIKENNAGGGIDNCSDDSDVNIPAVVIYIVDPFSLGSDNCDMMRLANLAMLRCFAQILPRLAEPLKNNIFLQMVSLESIFEHVQSPACSRLPSLIRGMAFSVYSQVQRPLQYVKDCKTLTGFGPASGVERYLKSNEVKAKFVRQLYQPAFVLAPPPMKRKISDTDSSFGSSVLFVNYCLSEDQHWLLASCSDDRGELVKTVVINIDIPNKTRRKKASARRVGLKRLMDWILSVMAMSLVPWRLVIGRIGRIGHGELRGWSVLLGRKALKKASKQLRECCTWSSDVPSILSACLVSLEPDSHLRLMSDQFTPDERFGQTASNCQLSTPKDASCSHILVFPTSATAQSSQKAFEDHQDGIGGGNNDLDDFVLPMDIGDLEGGDDDGLGDLKDIFSAAGDWGAAGMDQPGSPGSPGKRNSLSEPSSPSQPNQRSNEAFRYCQEEQGERLDILQQPLALGYLVSTAKTGSMPKWFWASCPHLENVCPVFLKSALHINQANILQGGDDGFAPSSSSGRVHSLDSTYTTDVLRYVLEGYNSLSWLSLDSVTRDRRSCLPLHVQILQQMYGNFAALI